MPERDDRGTFMEFEGGHLILALDLTEPLTDRYILANVISSDGETYPDSRNPVIIGWTVVDMEPTEDAAWRVVARFEAKEEAVDLWRRLTAKSG